MKKPILYSAELSPAVRGVWLTARALNFELENRSVNLLAGEHLKPEYVKVTDFYLATFSKESHKRTFRLIRNIPYRHWMIMDQ